MNKLIDVEVLFNFGACLKPHVRIFVIFIRVALFNDPIQSELP